MELQASAQGTFNILTDVPGNAIAQRFTFAPPTASTRRTVTARLPYNTQGHLIQCYYSPGAGQSTLYRVRVWARELPGGAWGWYPVPVIETAIEFSPAPLPIPLTPEAWTPAPLPIPVTPEAWSAAGLPIPVTPEAWSAAPLPIKSTPVVPDWIDLEVDA